MARREPDLMLDKDQLLRAIESTAWRVSSAAQQADRQGLDGLHDDLSLVWINLLRIQGTFAEYGIKYPRVGWQMTLEPEARPAS